MAGRGSVRASGNFNANQDAEILYKAMKGLGTDEDSIMKLLTSRSNSQRQQIKAAYKTLHGKDLVGDLKGELGGKFETLVVALMTPPILYDVTSLRNAIKGAGTDEKVLIEILSSRTAQQIKDITAAYRQEFNKNLEEDVTGDTSGHFRRLLVILLQASRQQGVQEGNIEADAQTLFSAGEKKFGTDEEQFITILGNRSTEHLRRVFAAYMKLAGYEMEESIQRETSGGLRDLLLAVVKCARSVPAYFAETLYYSMKGAGTDDQTLIRVMVSRSEVDMLDIRADYRRLFAKSLHSAIQVYTEYLSLSLHSAIQVYTEYLSLSQYSAIQVYTEYLSLSQYSAIQVQWGKKVFSQPPIVQVLPLKKMREACNFHHRYTSTMTDKMRRKKSRKSHCRIFN
uniref:Annexin n=1 Tax=Oncorhynchus kisutch TaxID=8019 RepID=A0A8C7LC33_ONCKI